MTVLGFQQVLRCIGVCAGSIRVKEKRDLLAFWSVLMPIARLQEHYDLIGYIL